MGDEHEVCVLHSEMNREISQQNKDIGKLSERLGRVEENTKDIPKILEAIEEIKKQRASSAGFIAGVAFIISGLVSVLTIWLSKGAH